MPLDQPSECPVSFVERRHSDEIGVEAISEEARIKSDERARTYNVVLVICLNINGGDPPDIVKPNPCARLECWIDPLKLNKKKALEEIGRSLQKKYQRLQPKARIRYCLDTCVQEVNNVCLSLRRNAKEDRVLMHYNGHGVPAPTDKNEIWVFNENITQYIPLSLYDLQTWMGSPCMYVWDCNCAGLIVESFRKFADRQTYKMEQRNMGHTATSSFGGLRKVDSGNLIPGGLSGFIRGSSSAVIEESEKFNTGGAALPERVPSPPPPNFKDCIHLAACSVGEWLPMNPDLPADLFSSCLTSPVKTAIMWHILQNDLREKLPLNLFDAFTGQPTDRRTVPGELTWVLTTVMDSIAWDTLPRDLFQKLFRQDPMVTSLFRNFLLAERIMRSYGCTPVSLPALPPTFEHPMWKAWDFALDACLDSILPNSANLDFTTALANSSSLTANGSMGLAPPQAQILPPEALLTETSCTHFFGTQFAAFESWLQYGYNRCDTPQQLPVLLQAVLSVTHRIRVMPLFERFLDLGPWAIQAALDVGLFSYALKLLQSTDKELRPHLAFVWAKILAADSSHQRHLVEDGLHQQYFLRILNDTCVGEQQKLVAAVVLACLLDNEYAIGQDAIMQGGFVWACADLLSDCKNSLLKRWLSIGLGRLWTNHDAARWQCIRCSTYEKLYELLNDASPEVRTAAVFALGTLIGNKVDDNEHAMSVAHSIALVLVQRVCNDMSPLVRRELVVALHFFALNFENQFITVAFEMTDKKQATLAQAQARLSESRRKEIGQTRRKLSLFSRKPTKSVGSDLMRPVQQNGSVDSTDSATSTLIKSDVKHFGTIAENLNAQALLPKSTPTSSRSSSVQTFVAEDVQKGRTSSTAAISKLLGFSGVGGGGNGLNKTRSIERRRESLTNTVEVKLRALSVSSSLTSSPSTSATSGSNVYVTVWRVVSNLASDPHPLVAKQAKKLIDRINLGVVQLHKIAAEQELALRKIKESGGRNSSRRESTTSKTSESEDDAFASSSGSAGKNNRPVFVVGSPESTAQVKPATSPRDSRPKGSKRVEELSSTPPTISIYSTIFTSPHRPVFGRHSPRLANSPPSTQPALSPTGGASAMTSSLNLADESINSNNQANHQLDTGFSRWCCRRFLEPMLNVVTTLPNPSDINSTGLMSAKRRHLSGIDRKINGLIQSRRRSSDALSIFDTTLQLPMPEWTKDVRASTVQKMEVEKRVLKETNRFETQLFTTRNSRIASCLLMLPYHEVLVTSSGTFLSVLLYTGESGAKLLINFDNDTNLSRSNVNFLDVVNPLTEQPLLVTGTVDGEVRIWKLPLDDRQAENNAKAKLVSAWNTVPFWLKSKMPFRARYFWEQDSATLFIGGDSNVISLWDAHAEQRVQEVALPSFSGVVTCVGADTQGQHVLACGCSDGLVRQLDCRLPGDRRHLTTLGEYGAPVIRLLVERVPSAARRLMAARSDGRVLVWDTRMFRDPLADFSMMLGANENSAIDDDLFDEPAIAFDFHAPQSLVAAAQEHAIRLATLDGRQLEPIQYHDGFMGQRLARVTGLAFHPELCRLAFGTSEGLVAVYGLS